MHLLICLQGGHTFAFKVLVYGYFSTAEVGKISDEPDYRF